MIFERMDMVDTHNYPHDTKFHYTFDGKEGHITLSFMSDDPDVGTEEMLYNGEGDIQELISDLLEEITSCLDRQEGVSIEKKQEIHSLDDYFNGFTRTALIAFESILIHIKNVK